MFDRLRRWVDRAGFLAVSSTIFVLGMVHGLQVARLQLQLVVMVLVVVWLRAAASSLLFAGGTLLAGALFLWRLGLGSTSPTPTDETVTAIVPVHRDAGVLDVSVESLLAMKAVLEYALHRDGEWYSVEKRGVWRPRDSVVGARLGRAAAVLAGAFAQS